MGVKSCDSTQLSIIINRIINRIYREYWFFEKKTFDFHSEKFPRIILGINEEVKLLYD